MSNKYLLYHNGLIQAVYEELKEAMGHANAHSIQRYPEWKCFPGQNGSLTFWIRNDWQIIMSK